MEGGKINVLIVEDNKINAIVLQKSIEKICQSVQWARNDTEAFKAVEGGDFKLILMDINLGGDSLDGEAIMKQIRSDERFRNLQIYAVTSYALPDDRARFLEAGFDAYFSKPIDKKAIIQAIQTLNAAAGTTTA